MNDDKNPSIPEKFPSKPSTQESPDQTINTVSSDDSNPYFDTTTVYSPGEIPRSTNKMADKNKATTNGRFVALDVDRMIGCFHSSHSCVSLCSIDSLANSYCGPDQHDDLHQLPGDDFFTEHVRFLRIQTAPHHVEVVWSPNTGPPLGGHTERLMYEV